jgi:H+/Cl- antiporter ClcA
MPFKKIFSKRPDRLLMMSLLGIVVGLMGGFVAQFLLTAIAYINNAVFFGVISGNYLTPNDSHIHGWVILVPAIGGLAVGLLIHYFSPEIKGDGIPEAMTVVLTSGSKVKPRVGFFKPLSAAITVGTGGPFGAEGPIIQTGGALGSILSQFLPCSPSERRTLLACGAAAGLAGVFKTPFAGLFMAVELLVFEFRARSFIPIALASACGTLVAMAFRGAGAVFPVVTDFTLRVTELPFFIVLAVACACLAWIMTRTLYGCEEFFETIQHRFKIWFPLIPAIGGLIVGAIGIFYPEVFGMGYGVIADLLKNPHTPVHLVGVGIAKLCAFAIALGSGASGGTFAPALMIGGSLGAAFGHLAHALLPAASSPSLYGMIATAALFGTIYRATPTAILFMLEVTHAYNAMFPLFLVAVIADLAGHYLMDNTINTEKLVKRGIFVPDAYSADPMRLFRVRQIMTTGIESVPAKALLHEFLAAAVVHDTLPVMDDQQHLVGLLHRSDLLQANGDATAASLAHTQYPVAYADESVHEVAMRLLQQKEHACPVLDRESGELVGFLTPYDLLKAKQWEHMQEVQEPGRMSLFSMLRVRSHGVQSSAEEEQRDAALETEAHR